MENKDGFKLTQPMAILIGCVIVSLSIYSNGGKNNSIPLTDKIEKETKEISVSPITRKDHIFGNPDAPIKIIVYSDTESPYSKKLHYTMIEIMKKYLGGGDVSWIYRHLPMENVYKKSFKEAVALECANEAGGATGFWKYLNELMEITPSNDGLDLSILPSIAIQVGIDNRNFEECLKSDKYNDLINSQIKEGVDAGATGSPYGILITDNNKIYPLDGALPFAELKSLIELSLPRK